MLETTWPGLEIGLSHCIMPHPWCMQSKGKVDEEFKSGEAARSVPDTRPSRAAAGMAVESLHPCLGHWPGLSPGLTRVQSPIYECGLVTSSQRVKTKTISLWHLSSPIIWYLCKAVKMTVVVASNKHLHVNCKPGKKN